MREGIRIASQSAVTHEISSAELDEDRLLDRDEARQYRAMAARLNYMAVDRVDLQFAVKESARSMANPKVSSWDMLVKIGRYLLGRPRLVIEFNW